LSQAFDFRVIQCLASGAALIVDSEKSSSKYGSVSSTAQQAVVLPMSRYDITDVGATQRQRV
jgi:hypothetical protein